MLRTVISLASLDGYDKKMSVEQITYELHQKAWSDMDNWYDHLNEAVQSSSEAIKLNQANDVVKNNYAALLLELHKNKEAYLFLKDNIFEFKENYANMGIAIAKTNPQDIERIRIYNSKSQELPSKKYAIEAYMDWQGL